MTYDAFMTTRSVPRPIAGVPGLAVRVGRTLEIWGRLAARRPSREQRMREHERRLAIEARMHASERRYREFR